MEKPAKEPRRWGVPAPSFSLFKAVDLAGLRAKVTNVSAGFTRGQQTAAAT